MKRLELDTRTKLEVAMARLHEDPYNLGKQGEVSHFQNIMKGIVTHKARGAAIRARVKWQKLGDKCTADFFKSVRQKYSQAVISSLKDKYGRTFTSREDFDRIFHDFYEDLYRHKEVSEGAFKEVFEGFPITFMDEMNAILTKVITKRELAAAVTAMAKDKAPSHDGMPMKFFNNYGQP